MVSEDPDTGDATSLVVSEHPDMGDAAMEDEQNCLVSSGSLASGASCKMCAQT